ncbi:hypothetical protein [Saccharothrix sp. NRRL B-16314]|uniref:hypothetical protein n=1 Tax=Saccharothrix sp. NRRL B-16314 TaxID=1463825 RepID=UPI0005266358|nr:hypothetical protein [Saccharothrix sp. NRRL B-16314]
MPLETAVQGDPASLRATAEWLRELARAAEEAGTTARGASTMSEAGWTGPAADSFRATVGATLGEVDGIAATDTGAAAALDAHAADLETVKARMAQAVAVASGAGLTVFGTLICEPSGLAEGAKLKAFEECLRTVSEADALERDSQSRLTDFFGTLGDAATHPATFLALDGAAGAAGAHFAGRMVQLSEAADRYTSAATTTTVVAGQLEASGRSIPSTQRWDLLRTNALNQREAERRSAELARLVGGQTATTAQNGRFILTTNIGNTTRWGQSLTGRFGTVVKNVPWTGLGLTAVGVGIGIGIGIEIVNEPTVENSIVAVTAGTAGLVASTAMASAVTTAMVGSAVLVGAPVLAPVAAGALVGVATAYVVQQCGDEAVEGVKDVGGAAVDKAKDIGKTVGGGIKKTFTGGFL